MGAQKGSIQEELVKTQLKGAKLVTIDKVPNMIVEVNQGSLAATVVEKRSPNHISTKILI